MSPTDREWLIAETLADSPSIFVLWMIANDKCFTEREFIDDFGDARMFKKIIRLLKLRGFIRQDSERLRVEPLGYEAIAIVTEAGQQKETGDINKKGGSSPVAIERVSATGPISRDKGAPSTPHLPVEDRKQWTDEQLFLAASRDDHEAFVELQTRLLFVNSYIEGCCSAFSLPPEVAYTISFQTLSRACKKIKGLSIPRGVKRRSWLQKLADKELRKWIANNQQMLPNETALPAHPPRLSPDDQRARKCFDRLNYEDQKILTLVMTNGLSVEEAGDWIGFDASESLRLYETAIKRLGSFVDDEDYSSGEFTAFSDYAI